MTPTDTITIQSLAQEARGYFDHRTQVDAVTFWTFKPDAPQWVVSMGAAAHQNNDIISNDYRYQFIVDTLDVISDWDCVEPAIDEMEPEIYTYELLTWLRDSHDGPGYVNEWMSEVDDTNDIVNNVQGGQLMEIREVAHSVLQSLTERLEALTE